MIRTERLCLREWKETDAAPFALLNADPAVMKYFPKLLTAAETGAFLERIALHFAQHGFGLFAVGKLETKAFIGFAGFMIPRFESYFTPCVEIGWRFKKEEWNRGYATEAAKACLQYGFNCLGFTAVYSFTSALNTPSERVMQKIGMKKEGEFSHPGIPPDNPLCPHVLYKIESPHQKTPAPENNKRSRIQ